MLSLCDYVSLNVLEKTSDAVDVLVNLMKTTFSDETGIIYCRTRKECEHLHKCLGEQGVVAMVYHAKVNPDKKEKVMNHWMEDKVKVVIATIAFGLGK